MDQDQDGLVSELDFASSVVGYTKRMASLERLHDLLFPASGGSTGDGAGGGAGGADAASAVYRQLDRVDGASGLVTGL